MFTTYILFSQKDAGYYFGHTNISARLKKHNSSQVKSTKSRVTLVLHYSEVFSSKVEAYRRELFFKSLSGRVWLYEQGILSKKLTDF